MKMLGFVLGPEPFVFIKTLILPELPKTPSVSKDSPFKTPKTPNFCYHFGVKKVPEKIRNILNFKAGTSYFHPDIYFAFVLIGLHPFWKP